MHELHGRINQETRGGNIAPFGYNPSGLNQFPIRLKQVVQLLREDEGHGWRRRAWHRL
jgi:hypothetical protein